MVLKIRVIEGGVFNHYRAMFGARQYAGLSATATDQTSRTCKAFPLHERWSKIKRTSDYIPQ